MQFNFSQPIPLTPEEVLTCMTSEPFQAEKARRLGTEQFSMEFATVAGTTVVTTHRRLPTVGLPEFVKALVKPMMVVSETERWADADGSGTHHGGFEIDVDGAPARFRGQVRVEPSDTGSVLTFEGTLSSTVPLFRSRIEEASAVLIRETMEVESALLEERAISTTVRPDPVRGPGR